jgi:hypothetical protein
VEWMSSTFYINSTVALQTGRSTGKTFWMLVTLVVQNNKDNARAEAKTTTPKEESSQSRFKSLVLTLSYGISFLIADLPHSRFPNMTS